ncbi:WecB/TagA/CpsF family glycosyltransferase, partial [Patescibacteria group bacterium]
SENKVLARVRDFITHNRKFYIVTPNPEIILASLKSVRLKEALNKSDLPIPDGVGLKLADSSLKIIKGRKLFNSLISLANKKSWKVFFLGGKGNEAEETAKKLKLSYKRVKIETFAGPKWNNNLKPVSEVDSRMAYDAIKKINLFKPHLLFVAFGYPKQEIWIQENLKKLDIGGAMAVGGVFRYVSGQAKLPPKFVEKLGLEWAWRFITEPWRTGRVIKAFIIFPWKVFMNKITKK